MLIAPSLGGVRVKGEKRGHSHLIKEEAKMLLRLLAAPASHSYKLHTSIKIHRWHLSKENRCQELTNSAGTSHRCQAAQIQNPGDSEWDGVQSGHAKLQSYCLLLLTRSRNVEEDRKLPNTQGQWVPGCCCCECWKEGLLPAGRPWPRRQGPDSP